MTAFQEIVIVLAFIVVGTCSIAVSLDRIAKNGIVCTQLIPTEKD